MMMMMMMMCSMLGILAGKHLAAALSTAVHQMPQPAAMHEA
jgi:hypothetical protein